MPVLLAVATFALASILIVVLPGPDTMVVMSNLIRGGRREGLRAVLGVLSGLGLWAAAAALGIAAVLRASETAYLVLRVAGAIYLGWLGLQALRSRVEPDRGPSRRRLLGTGYRAGLATDLLNPKVGVFFVTFLPGFVPSGEPMGLTSLLLGAVYVALTAAYFGLVLVFAGRLARALATDRVRRRLDRAAGTVLLGFAVRLVLQP